MKIETIKSFRMTTCQFMNECIDDIKSMVEKSGNTLKIHNLFKDILLKESYNSIFVINNEDKSSRDLRYLSADDIFDMFILVKRQFERNKLYSLIKNNVTTMIDWNNEIHIAASYEETEFFINSIVVNEKDKLIFFGTGIDGCSIEFAEDDFVDTEFGDILSQLVFIE